MNKYGWKVEMPTEVKIAYADFQWSLWIYSKCMDESIMALHKQCFITVDYK